MSTSIEQQNQNKKIIIDILHRNNSKLTLIELKQQCKLPNIYFFQALDTLEKEKSIQHEISEGDTLIQLL